MKITKAKDLKVGDVVDFGAYSWMVMGVYLIEKSATVRTSQVDIDFGCFGKRTFSLNYKLTVK